MTEELLKNKALRKEFYANLQEELEQKDLLIAQLTKEITELKLVIGIKAYKYSIWDNIVEVVEHNEALKLKLQKAGWVKQ